MSEERHSKANQRGIAVVCVAAVGAAVAFTLWARQSKSRTPGAIIDRCLGAIDEIEHRLLTGAKAAT